MRRPLPLLLLLALAPPASGQVEISEDERTGSLDLATRDLLDPDPIEHLGWGTLEDVFVDLGGGAAVSTLSGNLVLRIEPIARPDVPAPARMAFTYNHMEPEGAPDVAPGWTYTWARSWMPGAWGDRVLVDADGFRDSLWAGEPPSGEQLDRVTRQVIDAWRRDTPARDRRALGGVSALEELLVSDPSTLGAMRLRYLGAPDPEDERGLLFRSSARGVRVLEPQGKDVVLTLPDGTREVYDGRGALLSFEPARGAVWTAKRDQGVLDAVAVGGIDEWTMETDSRFRINKISDARGAVARMEYSGSQLQIVDSPSGEWRFSYDGRGRLSEASTPSGRVTVTYDDSTGRVASATGPRGSWRLGASLSDTGMVAQVDGPGGAFSVRWDAARRERVLERGGRQIERVVFAEQAALPTDVELESGALSLDWDDAGRLLRVAQDGREVRFDRDADGVLLAVLDPGGGRGPVEADADGVRAWVDPAGRRTTLERSDDGYVRAVLRTGGPDLNVQRHSGGQLSRVSVRQGPELILPPAERAVGEIRLDGASAGLRRDGDGAIVGFEGPTGRVVTLVLGPAGRVEQVRDDRATAKVRYADELLAGWTGPEGSRDVRRDGDGRPSALVEGGTARWEARWDRRGHVDRLLLDGAELLVEVDGDGAVASWQRPGGARTELERREDGAVIGRDDDATGELRLDLDRAGRATGVRRDSGRWELGRDRSGRLQRIGEPGGGVDFTLGAGGRPISVATRSGHAWRIQRDPVGRMAALEGVEATFTLEHARNGAPKLFTRPDGANARLDFDARGRWTGMGLPDGALSVSWGVAAPTAFGELRWRMDSTGALAGWGAVQGGDLRWRVDREADGRARSVRGPSERVIRRLAGGRQQVVGDLSLTWEKAGLSGITRGERQWSIERDSAGLVRRLQGPEGTIAYERERTGDARRVTVIEGEREGSAEMTRDPAGRLQTLTFAGGLGERSWSVTRDPMGRLATVERGPRERAEITWRDISYDDEGVLAEALAVQTDDPALRRENSGAWDIEVRAGSLMGQHPSRPGAGGLHGEASVLPDWVRDGLLPSGLRGMTLPIPQRMEPPQMLDGDAARAHRWWAGRETRVEDLALMPEGLPESRRAWASARLDAVARGAAVPSDVGRAGAGALLPPVPGASALVPGPVGARRVSALEALVLSGDLPGEALVWGELMGLPEEPWRFDLPGAAVLAALRPRLAEPAMPPWVGDGIAAVQPGGHGILTERGRRQERSASWEVHALIDGLPPGTADVLPGTPGWIAPLPGTTAADGRATVLDALSDDPLGARESALGQAVSDSVLLALHALGSGTETSLGGLLPDRAEHESWLVELPSGTRVVLDGRGRLLSVDAGGRLIRALVGAMSALVGGELLAPSLDSWALTAADDDAPWNPRYLPGRGATVESRWGLVPAVPAMPLDFRGRPTLPGWPR